MNTGDHTFEGNGSSNLALTLEAGYDAADGDTYDAGEIGSLAHPINVSNITSLGIRVGSGNAYVKDVDAAASLQEAYFQNQDHTGINFFLGNGGGISFEANGDLGISGGEGSAMINALSGGSVTIYSHGNLTISNLDIENGPLTRTSIRPLP